MTEQPDTAEHMTEHVTEHPEIAEHMTLHPDTTEHPCKSFLHYTQPNT